MSDLKRQLRSYIDGLEQPVSVQETMERRTARDRFRVPVAVMAGAAIVLVPAVVLIGLRMLPSSEGETADTTAPPTTITTSTIIVDTTTTRIDTTVEMVSVPDVNGLTVEEAQASLASVGLTSEVVAGRFDAALAGRVSAQEPPPGASVESGTSILLQVPQDQTCSLESERPEPVTGEALVSIMLPCTAEDWTTVFRAVPEDTPPITAVLNALLAGPTAAESATGMTSVFGPESAGALSQAGLDSGRLTVDFNESIKINNANTAIGSQELLGELQTNLFQFLDVDSIEFRIDGSCDAFWNWLQRDCLILTRDSFATATTTAPGSESP